MPRWAHLRHRAACLGARRLRLPLARLALGCIALILGLAGCTAAPVTPPTTEPIGAQLRRTDAALARHRFRALIDFEIDSDRVFVRCDGPAEIDSAQAHTGEHSLRLEDSTRQLRIRLSSVLAGQQFPGGWPLIGVYLYSTGQATATLEYSAGPGHKASSQTLSLQADAWTPVMVDVTEQPESLVTPDSAGEIRIALARGPGTQVWMDDLVIIDNSQTLVKGSDDSAVKQTWTVRRRGHSLEIRQPLRWTVTLKTAEAAPGGWNMVEAGDMRVRLASDGKEKVRTVYSDGRQFIDGRYEPIGPAKATQSAVAAAHQAPGEVQVPEAMGRINRMTPGDDNNDAYNEQLGAYQVTASGPRMDIRLTPAGADLVAPIIEIAALPEGQVVATVEGRLVTRWSRTADGHTLIEVPGQITRPTVVNVSVR